MAEDRRQLLQQADRAAQKGDMAGAAALFRRAASVGPPDPGLLQRLGDALARAGAEGEARDVFRQLADEYWKGGHRARALAALRRAARLGSPDSALLAQLGRRLAEQGLIADAREPLLDAAQIAEKACDAKGAAALYRQVAELLPRDIESREGLLRLAEHSADLSAQAIARAELALARLRSGDAAGAARAFAASLTVDHPALAALEVLPRLEAAAETGTPPLPSERPAGLSREQEATWALVSAASRPRKVDVRPALREAAHHPAAQPLVRLWAARLLIERHDYEGAAAALARLEPVAAGDDPLRRDVVEALTRIVTRAPGERLAVDALSRLGAASPGLRTAPNAAALVTPAGAVQTPEGLRRTAPRPAAGAPAPPGWPAGELSREARARLLEAQALLARGLAGPARAALESVPPEERQHPEILEFDVRVRVAAAPTPLAGTPAARTPSIAPQSVAGPRTGPAPPLPPSRHPGVDDAFVVLDDGGAVSGPELPNAAHTTLPPHAPQVPRAPLTTAPHVIPRPRADDSAGLQVDSDPLDVAQLETLLRQRVDPADAETNYQMALGLVEMGLDGQALPLLEGLLGDPARQIDATLLLVRVRRARGEVRRALKEAVAVLHAAGPAHIDLQAALTATIVELALETKRPLEARSFVEHLAHIAPNYPELPRLLARVEQSER